MKEHFNHQVEGVSPEQTRAALSQPKREATMVEQSRPFPELKPLGMGEHAVDRQHFRERQKQEQQRVQRYQIRVAETHTRIFVNGQLVDTKVERQVTPINRSHYTSHEFNMSAAYEHDHKELGLSL